jgi:hypothetical protein
MTGTSEVQTVVWTTKRRNAIRTYYPFYLLTFCKDGTVMGQKGGKGSAKGILYTPQQAIAHLREIGLMEKAKG